MDSILSVLSPEVMLQVVSFIDDRRDLLSLALTCRVLSQILLPDYIDHMEIQTPPHMTEVWDSLLERPVLANCVKTLGLIHSINEFIVIPPRFRTKEFLRKAHSWNSWDDSRIPLTLYQLFSRLENLTCLRVIFQLALPKDMLYDLSEAVTASGCRLEKLEIELRCAPYWEDIGVNNPERGLPFIPQNLSSLSGLSFCIERCTGAQTQNIIGVLIQVPCLTQLRLRLPVLEGRLAQVLRILFTLQWPMLRHLTIQQLNNPITSIGIENHYIVDFLTLHADLETLYFEGMLPLGCFSSIPLRSTLRSLHYMSQEVGEFVPRLGDILPTSIAKHLVHLSIGGAINNELGIEENGLSALQTCVLPSLKADSALSLISELVKAAPNLQRCAVNIAQTTEIKPISESLRLFTPLTSLTHLFGLLRKIDYLELSSQQFLDSFYDIPSLTYINASTPQGKPCMHIIRQPNIRFQIIPFNFAYRVSHLKSTQWGGFFQGFPSEKTVSV